MPRNRIARDPSSVWKYFSKVIGENKIAKCKKCLKILSYKSSVTNLKTHLRLKHKRLYCKYRNHLNLGRAREVNVSNRTRVEAHSSDFNVESHEENLSETEELIEEPFTPEKKRQIDTALIGWIVHSYLPVTIVESESFIRLMEALNPDYVLPGRKEITKKVIPFLYNRTLSKQKSLLQKEAVTISLTIDFWNSSRMDSFICVTAHFITDEFEMKSVVLKCSVFLDDPNTCHDIELILNDISTEWGVQDKIKSCITNNDISVVEALNTLGWTHYGCIVHALNIILELCINLHNETLNRVNRIVNFYRSDEEAEIKLLQYQELVKESAQPLKLKNPIIIGWNSTYIMLERFVYLQDSVIATMPDVDVELPVITDREWLMLKQLCTFLKPFYEVTTELSTEKYASASKVIPIINGLKDAINEAKNTPEAYDNISNVLDCMESQFHVHFKDLELQDKFVMCTLLDPRYKISKFKNDEVAERAQNNLVSEVLKLMKEKTQYQLQKEETKFKGIDNNSKNIENMISSVRQEVELYIEDDLALNDCNPHEWWKSSQYKYPYIAKLFKNNYMVANSVPADRLFTKSGCELFDNLKSLSLKKTEMLVFLNSNMGNCEIELPMSEIEVAEPPNINT